MAGKNQKFWDQVLKEVAAQDGFTLIRSPRNNHFKVTREGYSGIVWLQSTPGDYRGMQNSIAQLRRDLGFVWQGR